VDDPRTTVIVLTWNGKDWLGRCLDAVLREPGDFEVVVVDNASSDGTAAFVEATFPSVRLVPLARNLGFAAGNNAGARAARGRDYLAFLNNDTEVERGWLPALVDALDNDPGAALAASHITSLDRPGVIDSAGDGYLRAGGGFKRHRGELESDVTAARETFGVCGAACLIRRGVFESLGGFDERFFMVYEDVDLSYRARLAGHRACYVAAARVRHAGSATLGRLSASAVYYGQRNLEWTWWKNTPGRLLLRSAPAHAAYVLAGIAHYARLGLLGPCLRGKVAALGGLPRIWRQRRELQRDRIATSRQLRLAMTGGWIGVKRREKHSAERY
jgi:GT2 family glycosyltransferase